MGEHGQELVFPPICLLTLRLELLLLRDIAPDLGCSDDAPRPIPHRRNRKRHIDDSSIFPTALGFVVFDRFAVPDLPEDLVHVLDQLGWHEHRHMLADHFLGPVAENPLGAPIPTSDDAIQILGNNDVVRRLNDRSQSVPQYFRLADFGDVPPNFGRTDDHPIRIADR